MDVKLFEKPDPAPLCYRDLMALDFFVFSDAEESPNLCLTSESYMTCYNQMVMHGSQTLGERAVTKLELAGTEGQTLLLRRAE